MDIRFFCTLILVPALIAGCGGGGGGGSSSNNTSSTSTTTTGSSESAATTQPILLPTVQLSGQMVTLQINAGSPSALRSAALHATQFAVSQKDSGSVSAFLVIDGITWRPVCTINAGVQSSGGSASIDQACISDFTVLQASGVNIGNGAATGTMHIAASHDQFLSSNLAVTPLTEIAYADVHLALAAGRPLTEITSELDALAKRLLRSDLNGDSVIDYRDVLAWRPSMSSALRIDLTPLYNTYSSGEDVGIVAAQMAKAATLGSIPTGDNSDPISSDNPVFSLSAINNVIYTTTSDLNTPQIGNDSNNSDTSGWLHASTTNGDSLWRAAVGSRVQIRATNANYLVAIKNNPLPSTIIKCPEINPPAINPKCLPDNELLIAQIPSSVAPAIIRLPLAVSIDDVTLSGSKAILATSSGLIVIDLTRVVDSAIALDVNSLPTIATFGATGDDVAYDSGKIYLATRQSLTTFNLTNSGISQLGQVNFTLHSNGIIRRVAVAGGHLYIAAGLAGVLNIDISNPANPSLVNTFYEGSSLASAADIYDVFPTASGVISLGDSSGLRTLTLDASGSLQPNGRLFVRNIDGGAYGGLLGNELFFISKDNELRRSEIGAFAGDQWRVAATAIPGAKATTLTVNGTTAYVGSSPDAGGAEVIALDISNPSAMSIQREYPVGGFIFDLTLRGNIAAIANSTWDYQALDLQSGAVNRVGLLGGTLVGITPFGSDDLVFDRSGYAVYDATDPANPIFKGVYDRSVDPTCGKLGGNCDLPDSWSGLVAGSTLFEASGQYGLSVVQLNADGSPGSSTRISSSDGAGWQGTLQAYSVTKDGNQLYVAGGCATGLFVLDVSSVTSPRVQANTQGVACPWHVVLNNHVAYVMDMDAGMSVYDVTQPSNPVYIGSMPTDGPATKGWAGQNNVFVVDQRALNAFPMARSLPPSSVK